MQGKSISLPSSDSFDGDDVRGSSAADGSMSANPASDSTASAASSPAKQVAPLDVIREDEEDKPRQLSPGSSLHSIEVGSQLMSTQTNEATPMLARKGFAKGGSAGSIRRDAVGGLQGVQYIKQDMSIQDRQIRDQARQGLSTSGYVLHIVHILPPLCKIRRVSIGVIFNCADCGGHVLQEREEDGDAEEHELEPLARQDGHHSDGEGAASDCDDDAASEASSEALALAVATEEAAEEEEAAEAPKEPKFGLTRLGSLLPRRADAGQEGLFGTMLRHITSCQRHITAFKPVDRIPGRSATLLGGWTLSLIACLMCWKTTVTLCQAGAREIVYKYDAYPYAPL